MIKIKKHIRSSTDEGINDYIEALETELLSVKASNTLRLILKLDEINGIIVDDLQKIIDGTDIFSVTENGELVEKSTLRVLHDSSQNKTFDRVLKLFEKLKDLKAVGDYVENMAPEIEETVSIKDTLNVDTSRNMFEQIKAKVDKK